MDIILINMEEILPDNHVTCSFIYFLNTDLEICLESIYGYSTKKMEVINYGQ